MTIKTDTSSPNITADELMHHGFYLGQSLAADIMRGGEDCAPGGGGRGWWLK